MVRLDEKLPCYSTCQPEVVGSTQGFSSLSDENLSQGLMKMFNDDILRRDLRQQRMGHFDVSYAKLRNIT